MTKAETSDMLLLNTQTAKGPSTSDKTARKRVASAAIPKFEPLLTVEETATALHTSTKTVRRRIASGDLPAVRIGRLRRVRPADLRWYIATHLEA